MQKERIWTSFFFFWGVKPVVTRVALIMFSTKPTSKAIIQSILGIPHIHSSTSLTPTPLDKQTLPTISSHSRIKENDLKKKKHFAYFSQNQKYIIVIIIQYTA